MRKKIDYKRLMIVSGVIITFALISDFYSKWARDNSLDLDLTSFAPSYKENSKKSEFKEHLDSVSNIYSNFHYGFSIDYPDNWELDRGGSEHTVIRGVQKDSLYTLAVIVVEISDIKQPRNIWEMWDKNIADFRQKHINFANSTSTSEVNESNVRKVYLSNHPTLETTTIRSFRSIDAEIDFISILYSTFKDNMSYTVGLTVPEILYYRQKVYFDSIIRRFTFLIQLK